MSMKHDYCMVLSTTSNEKNRDQIIKGLLDAQLAACIQTMPIESHYVWKGEICTDNEWLLVIKTRRELY
ncbi:divalent-cation tolerance protein CutA, partial [Vibrio parahaemolyticus]|nr:divalent-cation tolerance protein CutA [Vibrio parahaemolyticus]